MTARRPLVVHDTIIVVPVAKEVQRAIDDYLETRRADLDGVLAPFGLSTLDVIAPMFQRIVWDEPELDEDDCPVGDCTCHTCGLIHDSEPSSVSDRDDPHDQPGEGNHSADYREDEGRPVARGNRKELRLHLHRPALVGKDATGHRQDEANDAKGDCKNDHDRTLCADRDYRATTGGPFDTSSSHDD